MQKVSILGCGWLGKPLAISFLSRGFSVKGSTKTEDKLTFLRKENINPFLVDISQQEISAEFLESDILISAITSKSEDDFARLISKIEQSKIKKVIFISSTSVYPSLNKIMTEADETDNHPLVIIENLFRKNTHFETTIIRFSGLFGGERHPAIWFQKGRKIPQPNGFVNMIHLEDCIAIIEKIIAQNCFGETFNACSNHHPTRKDFYENARKSKGFEPPFFEENEVLNWKIISSEKLQKTLNYQFLVDDLLWDSEFKI
ncbi:MAG: NAD(P)H-binding protein [Flavobacteriia bacterium]|nr:NAD(P)H-binding protein [Flavobacteriia bacterium]OIP47215.1 MAG: dTDP-glucose 4,6-dehydratase [Flavobacteriaceae bacterium CG2_30_31_66]PIV96020.1 MAG: dTDP-glucose 4,6-dehydratase [Flavobacteriaceae bacterium CG17_big_fil_post_rev_8_21_14_2_50_31_13]PIY13932.1 MAG: dTDP-glucose 4,6-dehydratase [Flavobacteriaceae bacterium CG_4_10_14_3_um_filter_31_253]PIZ10974.1 MAG: dTDP-glucose 4,6-dehydratase [Flavobacteriaceae bacterium CG_4_10_14_0_8_um_filter_31_99]PJC10949.1 MAG: dTDP-glucose 4,6-d